MADQQQIAAAAILLFDDSDDESEQSCGRRWWVGPQCAARDTDGAMHTTVPKLLLDGKSRRVGTFAHYLRFPVQLFHLLLSLVYPMIVKQDTHLRLAIDPETRLACTLRYLATGTSMANLHYEFNLGVKTISNIISETCQAIYTALEASHLKLPSCQVEWKSIADGFLAKWNYPNCIGALDGKHVRIRKPNGAGSEYHNYKGYESVVLMAMVDANQKFIYVEVGANGRSSDAGLWRDSPLRANIESQSLSIPPPSPLPLTDDIPLPYHIIGDEAFPLKPYMMRPYPRGDRAGLDHSKLVFNYRLSRARRIVENAFGKLAAMWHIFQKPINVQPEKVDILVMACCSLQNFLIDNHAMPFTIDTDAYVHDGSWREEVQQCMTPLARRAVGNNVARSPKVMQDQLKEWFCGPGAVNWQDRMVCNGHV